MKELRISTVTVIGANGTMGGNISAIFAAFGNAKVYMVSRTLEKSIQAKERAFHSVKAESVKNNMVPADYSMLEQCIAESDIVFESSAENWSVKCEITGLISEAAKKNLDKCGKTVFCTGTSGLSITALAELFPEELKQNYMGMHMFNPPYTMTLCEMTPTKYSNRELFDAVCSYCRDKLHRTVVEVKDSPAFLGNRIGFQFINEALQYAEKYKYNGGIDYIDALLGPFTGRSMAPLVTSNFVGLDVHKAIVDNLYKNTNDFARNTFLFPDYAEKLIKEGHLGRKAGGGLYKTVQHDSGVKIHQVYDIESGTYRNVLKYSFPFIETVVAYLREGAYEEAFDILKRNRAREAEITCYFLIKYIIYSLMAASEVGYDVHSADDVMATGFNWCPPLALLEAFGGPMEFRNLCLQRLDESALRDVNLDDFLSRVEPSKYDFRKFVKAKR